MKQLDWKSMLPHLIAVVVFLAFHWLISPRYEGKKLYQSDKVNFIGMSKEITDHRENYNEEPLWTNSMFGGMPAIRFLLNTMPIL